MAPPLMRQVYIVALHCRGNPAALCAKLHACLGSDAALVLEALSENTVYLASEMHTDCK